MIHMDSDRFSAKDIGGKTMAFITGSVWVDGIVNLDDATNHNHPRPARNGQTINGGPEIALWRVSWNCCDMALYWHIFWRRRYTAGVAISHPLPGLWSICPNAIMADRWQLTSGLRDRVSLSMLPRNSLEAFCRHS